jgi:hypothetical protein
LKTDKGKIQTLLHEPKFRLFYETPAYELTQVEREGKYLVEKPSDSNEVPWPETEFIFGEDLEYQTLISDIMRIVTMSLSNVEQVSKVD